MSEPDIARIDVLAPNFKRRMSGVTSTVLRLVPLQAQEIAIASAGPRLPADMPQTSIWQLLTMPRRGPNGARVWHARRNAEMLAGIALKRLLAKKLKLVFTSAAQRDHSAYTKWLIRQMDAVVATSTRSAAYLEVPHRIIRHGIDADRFAPAPDKQALRADLGLPQAGLLVGCYGRIRPQKGSDLFVEAMVALLHQRPEVTALLMGGVTSQFREFSEGLKARISDSGLEGRIRILPEAPDWEITSYFQVLDLYIAPQRWEGFGLTPLEAMACAVPVVATRVGAFEELVVDGETGALIAPEDLPALIAASAHYLDDETALAHAGQRARAHVASGFRIEGEAAALVGLYRELLGVAQPVTPE